MIELSTFIQVYKPCLPTEIFENYTNLYVHANKLSEPLRKVCHKFLDDERIIKCPAANCKSHKTGHTGHQSFDGGLIVHTNQVLNSALNLARTEDSIDDICFENLICGAILHDWGKLFVFDENSRFYIQTPSNYTVDQMAIFERHLPRSYAEFMIASSEWDVSFENDRLAIAHIILSHHGKLEWGSPVECKTTEAYIVHLADVYSSRVMKYGDIYNTPFNSIGNCYTI